MPNTQSPQGINQDCLSIRKQPACALPTVCTTASTTVSAEEQGLYRDYSSVSIVTGSATARA